MAGRDPATQTLPRVMVLGHWLRADDGEILGKFEKMTPAGENSP
jgi:hypothetical protein